MTKHIVRGSSVPLNKERLGLYIFNNLKYYNPADVLMVSSELNEEYTAEDIRIKSIKLAIALRKYIKPGDVIAAICENDNLTALPLVASTYLGTTIAFVNPYYNARELRHSLSNLNPKFVFCCQKALNNLMQIKDDVGDIEEIIIMEREPSNGLKTLDDFINNNNTNGADIETFKPTELGSEDDTAVILSSSGTTGLPKGVNITYRNLTARLMSFKNKNFIAVQPGEVTVILVPVFHLFGLLLMFFSVVRGAKAVFIKRFKPEPFLSSLEKFKVTILFIVPPLAIFLAKNPIVLKYDLSSIKDILCGAAPIGKSIIDMVYQRFKIRIRQIYGLTETGILSCVPPNFPPEIISSVGRVSPNVEIAIKDVDTRQILPPNQTGEICVKGPDVSPGYFCNEEANKSCFDTDGYFLTGDIGYFDENGNLFVVDRLKELIKYKGFQVAPAELESILLKHEAVKDVAVVGKPDEDAGELPTAFVVRRPSIDVTESTLATFVAAQVSTYKQLSGGVKFVDEIPKNPSGKILRRTLKDKLMEEQTVVY